MQRLFKYIEQLIKAKFHGKLEILFQHGHPCNVRLEQNYKMKDLPEAL